MSDGFGRNMLVCLFFWFYHGKRGTENVEHSWPYIFPRWILSRAYELGLALLYLFTDFILYGMGKHFTASHIWDAFCEDTFGNWSIYKAIKRAELEWERMQKEQQGAKSSVGLVFSSYMPFLGSIRGDSWLQQFTDTKTDFQQVEK